MAKTTAWAIKIKNRNRFVNFPYSSTAHFEAYRVMTFKTKYGAVSWMQNDSFWRNKGEVVKVNIVTKEWGT